MERQLDAPAVRMLKRAVEARALPCALTPRPRASVGDRRVEAVELRDGRAIAADAVVVAVGIRANTGLARDAGLKVDRGIAVDDHLETSVRASTRSASVPSIAGSATGWWSPPMSKRRCWRGGLPGRARPTAAACPPPI
jgi:NAD(P)H-nitrite reductase